MSRNATRTILLLVLLLAASCKRVGVIATSFGIADPPKPAPVTVDVICDVTGSETSGCTTESLSQTITTIVPQLAPASLVRLQGMGNAVYDVRELSRFVITASVKKTRRALLAHEQQQTVAVREQFLAAAAPLFERPERRASPIAETIARSIAAGSTGEHHIIVLTDARLYTYGTPSLGSLDFECGRLPDVDDFTARLQALFPPDSLKAAVIHFANAQLDPIAKNRCVPTMERYTAIRDLWTGSLARLDARVTWSMGPLTSLGGAS